MNKSFLQLISYIVKTKKINKYNTTEISGGLIKNILMTNNPVDKNTAQGTAQKTFW